MLFDRFPLVYLIAALIDYVMKAVLNYRLTDDGAAEWSDVEAAFAQVTGDDERAEDARSEAAAQRVENRARDLSREKRTESRTAPERFTISEE